METNQKKRGIFSVILPLIIRYVVQIAVEVVVLTKLMLEKLPDMIENTQTAAAAQKMMETYMPQLLEEYLGYLPVVTIAVDLLLIPAFLMLYRSDIKYEKMLGTIEKKKTPLVKYIAIIGIAVPMAIAASNILTLSNAAMYSRAYQETAASLYSVSFGLQLIGYGMIVPIAEEFMFRGVIYKRLTFLSTKKKAMIVSALIFAIYHGNLIQGIYAFILGCIGVYLYERYGSLKAPMLFHMAANTASVIATEYKLFNWVFKTQARVGIVTVLCAALASAMFVLMQKICTENQMEESHNENDGKEIDTPSL